MNSNSYNNSTWAIYYSPFDKNGERKESIVTLENGEFSKTLRQNYRPLFFKYFTQNLGDKDIRDYLENNNSGHIWGTIFYGVAFISSGEIKRTEGALKTGLLKSSIKFGNKDYTLSEILGYYKSDTKLPEDVNKGVFGKLHIGRIKDYAWYALVFVLAYYILTQIFSLLF